VFKRSLIFATALLLVCQFSTVSAYANSSTKPVSSLAKLEVVLAKSIKQRQLPVNMTPSITQLVDGYSVQGSSYLRQSCDPYDVNSQAKNPVPCWYGSSSASRTVVIFGDSFVGNWIPALNIAGKALGFKVAEFSFSGCTTPFVNPSGPAPGFDESEVQACITFHENLPTSVNRLNPIAVIAADGAPSWASNAAFITGLDTAFNEMSTPTNQPKRILMGGGPHLSEPSPSCLAIHLSDISRCNFTYSPGSGFSAILSRDEMSVHGARVNLIPVYRWLCLRNTCPAVIGHVAVYADTDHMTIAASEYLSILLEKSLASILGPATA
jgi:hypothetical protein